MTDYDKLFIEGQEVSAFVKNSNKIWEGIVVNRSDNVKVVLNEKTNTWKRLSDLEHVKRIGRLLHEEAIQPLETGADFVKMMQQKIDPDKLKTTGDAEKYAKAIEDMAKAEGFKEDLPGKEELASQVESETALKAGQEATPQTAGDQQKMDKAKEEMAKYTNQVQETLSGLHPLLQPHLQEMANQDHNEIKDAFLSHKAEEEWTIRKLRKAGVSLERAKELIKLWTIQGLSGIEAGMLHESKKDLDYENDDYTDTSDDDNKDIILAGISALKDDVEDLKSYYLDNYEMNEDDAEEFAIAAMEKYIDDSNIEVRDSIKDAADELEVPEQDIVEDEFESAIEEYDGEDDGLLDHLVQEFEIDPKDAEFVYEEKRGNLTECVYGFIDLVKKKLTEDKNRFIDKNENLDPIEKQNVKDFFKSHPSYESKIDWNKAKSLTYDDFKQIMDDSQTSKSQLRKKVSEGDLKALFTGKEKDFDILFEDENALFTYVKTYEGAVFADSFNCNGQGAKWCIGYDRDSHYWHKYIQKGFQFVLVLFKKPINDNKKVMLQIKLRLNEKGYLENTLNCWVPSDCTSSYKNYISDKKKIIDILKNKYPKEIVPYVKRVINVQQSEIKSIVMNTVNEQMQLNMLTIYNKRTNKLVDKFLKSFFTVKGNEQGTKFYCKIVYDYLLKYTDDSFLKELEEQGIVLEIPDKAESPTNNIGRDGIVYFLNEDIGELNLKKGNMCRLINCTVNKLNIYVDTKNDDHERIRLFISDNSIIKKFNMQFDEESLQLYKEECIKNYNPGKYSKEEIEEKIYEDMHFLLGIYADDSVTIPKITDKLFYEYGYLTVKDTISF